MVPDYCSNAINMKLKLTMPYARKHWQGSLTMDGQTDKMFIASGNKSATYEANFKDEDFNAATWKVDGEDKPGLCTLEVYLNDRLVKSFPFQLVLP